MFIFLNIFRYINLLNCNQTQILQHNTNFVVIKPVDGRGGQSVAEKELLQGSATPNKSKK